MLTTGMGYDSIYLVAARATWNLKTIQKKIAKKAKENLANDSQEYLSKPKG